MGTPGVPLNIPKESIAASIKSCRGRMTHMAPALDCSIIYLRERINADPELVALLAETRNHRDENLLDGAEDTLQFALDQRKDADGDINAALKSAFFVLNNKGRKRGYIPANAVDPSIAYQVTPEQLRQIQAQQSPDG